MIGEHLARKMLKPINTSAVSILGASNLLMGFWLILPLNSLGSSYDNGPLFQEWIYGVMLLIIGGLVVTGSVKNKVKTLSWGTGLGFIFWFTWTIFLMLRSVEHIDWIWVTTYALYYGFVHLNSRVNRNNIV